MDVYQCSDAFIQLYEDEQSHALVYRQYRLSSHPSLERKDSILQTSRSFPQNTRIATGKMHDIESGRNIPVLTVESMGHRKKMYDRAPGDGNKSLIVVDCFIDYLSLKQSLLPLYRLQSFTFQIIIGLAEMFTSHKTIIR